MTLLNVDQINTGYGESHVLHDVSLSINEGEVVSLLGRNGAGKSTTLKSIIGIQPPFRGEITYRGKKITDEEVFNIAKSGIKYVPEDRRVFEKLTVKEHLLMAETDQPFEEELDYIYSVFPKLKELESRDAGNLSGGEQQMLAIARALIGTTDILLLDEPSEGLAPQIVETIFEVITDLKEDTTILLVEQNFALAQAVADRYYILDQGEIVSEGGIEKLDENPELKKRYLGVSV